MLHPLFRKILVRIPYYLLRWNSGERQLILHQSVPADLEDPVSGGKLIITTSEGTTYVYGISEPYLIDPNNQCWSCPAFFSEFNNMIK